MLNDFLNSSSPHLHKKWLIAVSGGIDSMVLWDLVSKAKINYGIAHCNFNLRGNESLEDQNFVHNRAIDLKVPFFSQSFNTYKYAKEKKISIQEAARFLRYDWLFTIAKEHDFNIISTGHQLNDEIETIIFRIAKGTGFKGLRGIPQENGIIFRPLLFASSEQINSYALEMNIEFRNDSSNLSRKYSRNLIRLEIIPKLKNINPELEKTFAENLSIWKQSFDLYKYSVNEFSKKAVTHSRSVTHIDLTVILNSPAPLILLYEIIHPLDFNKAQCEEIIEAYLSKGKKWITSNKIATLDSTELLIFPKILVEPFEIFWDDPKDKIEFREGFFLIGNQGNPSEQILVNLNKLKWPLKIRNWRKGDTFYPAGMNGQSKKLKKYFTDNKFNYFQKNTTLILTDSENNIIWLVGHRADQRFLSPKNGTQIQFYRNV